MKRPIVLVAVAGAAVLAAALAFRFREPSAVVAAGPPVKAALDPARWLRTSEGDFEESVVDAEGNGDRVRLRAATRGTRDETVKFLGARSVKKAALEPGARISARFDWNRQANGSYLSGALILSPEATAANPLSGPDWFKVEYIGVPPGENARLLVACRTQGRERFLFTDGWPDANRKGREIGVQKIEIAVRTDGGLQVLENGAVVFESTEKVLPSAAVHVYLQLSTHSNYPPRELFFDEIRFPGGP